MILEFAKEPSLASSPSAVHANLLAHMMLRLYADSEPVSAGPPDRHCRPLVYPKTVVGHCAPFWLIRLPLYIHVRRPHCIPPDIPQQQASSWSAVRRHRRQPSLLPS